MARRWQPAKGASFHSELPAILLLLSVFICVHLWLRPWGLQANDETEILSDDADLLREFAAARWLRVHHDRVRRHRALQAHVRLRRRVPYRHGRARRQYRARRGEPG